MFVPGKLTNNPGTGICISVENEGVGSKPNKLRHLVGISARVDILNICFILCNGVTPSVISDPAILLHHICCAESHDKDGEDPVTTGGQYAKYGEFAVEVPTVCLFINIPLPSASIISVSTPSHALVGLLPVLGIAVILPTESAPDSPRVNKL